MDCKSFRSLYRKFTTFPQPADVAESDECADWHDHGLECARCSEWFLRKEIEGRGYDASDFPCIHIAYRVTQKCDDHDDPLDCPDTLIAYWPKFDEYGLVVHDGTRSVVVIEHCPWCGVKLAESKRNRWFEELADRGFDDPLNQDIPEEYRSDAWWRGSR